MVRQPPVPPIVLAGTAAAGQLALTRRKQPTRLSRLVGGAIGVASAALAELFGAQWRAYAAAVPRWLGEP